MFKKGFANKAAKEDLDLRTLEPRARKYRELLEGMGFKFNDVGGWPESLSFYKEEGSGIPYKSTDSVNVQINLDENKMYLNDYQKDYHPEFDITNDNIPMAELKALSDTIKVKTEEEKDIERTNFYNKLKSEGRCLSCQGTGYRGPHGVTCHLCEGSGYNEPLEPPEPESDYGWD